MCFDPAHSDLVLNQWSDKECGCFGYGQHHNEQDYQEDEKFDKVNMFKKVY